MTARSNTCGGFASMILTLLTFPFSSISMRAMTVPEEMFLRIASLGYSGLTRESGTIPLRTAGLGCGGGGAGGAITGGAVGGVAVTAAMTGSDCVVGGGMSGGGTYTCGGGGTFGISIFFGGGGGGGGALISSTIVAVSGFLMTSI